MLLLESKTAVVYGGSGTVGGAVARAFAREGASVYLAGRTRYRLQEVAEEIRASGGEAEVAEVDVLVEGAVDDLVDSIVESTGRIDVSFNAISYGDTHGTPVLEMPYDEFNRPIADALRSHFLIARGCARHMASRGSGVILTLTAVTARQAIPEVGGTAVRFDATEGFCRQLAAELGPSGIRVVTLRTTGLPEAVFFPGPFPDYGTGSGSMTRDELIEWMEKRTMLKRLTTLADVANVAAFIASDRASAITGSVANINCGSVVD